MSFVIIWVEWPRNITWKISQFANWENLYEVYGRKDMDALYQLMRLLLSSKSYSKLMKNIVKVKDVVYSKQFGHKKKKTDRPPTQPSRRSSRLQGKSHEDSSSKVAPSSAILDLQSQNKQQPNEIVKHQRTPSVSLNCVLPPNPWKDEWIKDYGCQLFNVTSNV